MRIWYTALFAVVVVLATAAVPAMAGRVVLENDDRDKSENKHRMRMRGWLQKTKLEIIIPNDETFRTSEQEDNHPQNFRNKKLRAEDNRHPDPRDDIAKVKRVVTGATTASIAR